jgi:diaminopimelate decarboxylase
MMECSSGCFTYEEYPHDNILVAIASKNRSVPSPFVPTSTGLHCDGVRVADIVNAVGTPVYLYSANAIQSSYRAIDDAFATYPHRIHYALKANSTLAIVRLLRSLGSRADANSGGEVRVALHAGFEAADIVLTGVGKTRDELAHAIACGVGTINAESAGEIDRIAAIASAEGLTARVALRVNPDIDAKSHPNISTGLRTNKFGVAIQEARGIYRARLGLPGVRLTGVHIHIGSQITTVDPLERAAEALVSLALELTDVDVLEPGRAVVGHAGAIVGTVVDAKQFPDGRKFAVLDAGMGELIRPAMYGSYHQIVPVSPRPGAETPWDVVGPICESSDVFGRDRLLPPLEVDDLVAILDTGAYGAAMASNYLRHPLAPEVMVSGGEWHVIRRRQTLEELLSLES